MNVGDLTQVRLPSGVPQKFIDQTFVDEQQDLSTVGQAVDCFRDRPLIEHSQRKSGIIKRKGINFPGESHTDHGNLVGQFLGADLAQRMNEGAAEGDAGIEVERRGDHGEEREAGGGDPAGWDRVPGPCPRHQQACSHHRQQSPGQPVRPAQAGGQHRIDRGGHRYGQSEQQAQIPGRMQPDIGDKLLVGTSLNDSPDGHPHDKAQGRKHRQDVGRQLAACDREEQEDPACSQQQAPHIPVAAGTDCLLTARKEGPGRRPEN